jgi:hypothetical protein
MVINVRTFIDYKYGSPSLTPSSSTPSADGKADECVSSITISNRSSLPVSSSSSSSTPVTPSGSEPSADDLIKDAKAKYFLMKNIDQSMIYDVMNVPTAYDIWQYLTRRYGKLTRPLIHAMKRRLEAYRIPDDGDIQRHLIIILSVGILTVRTENYNELI